MTLTASTTLVYDDASQVVTGVNGMAEHPSSGEIFAVVRIQGTSSRRLVTLDTSTGIVSEIGAVGFELSSLAFDATGAVLYALTGDGGSPAETLCEVNTTKASTVCNFSLGNGTDFFAAERRIGRSSCVLARCPSMGVMASASREPGAGLSLS